MESGDEENDDEKIERDEEEKLPWEHISCGVSTDYLRIERQKATKLESTKNCLTDSCSNCGFGSDCPVHSLKKETKG